MLSEQRLIRLIQALIRINSENPPGDESRIAAFVKNYFKTLKDCRVRTIEFKRGRTNVLAFFKGKGRETLLLSPHLDTVPAGCGWKYSPFSGRLKNNRIYGRGASDCKVNLAVAMEVMRSLSEEKIPLNVNVILAACADEETGSRYGIEGLLKRNILKPDAAVILDSDDFNIIVVQKGLIHFKVKLYGKKAHGAYPWRGINAIEQAAEIISVLKRHKFPFKKHSLLHSPTINIGTVSGGDKVNIVADWCEFEVDLRFLPGMDYRKIIRDVKAIIIKFTKRFKIEIEGIQRPYEISTFHPLVKYLRMSAGALKIAPKIKGSEGATVITFFQDREIPAVSIGFGTSGCAHITNEYVEVKNLYRGARLLREFLRIYPGIHQRRR